MQLDIKEFQTRLSEEERRLKSLLPSESDFNDVMVRNGDHRTAECEGPSKSEQQGEGEREGEGEGEGEGRGTNQKKDGDLSGDVVKQIAVVRYLKVRRGGSEREGRECAG